MKRILTFFLCFLLVTGICSSKTMAAPEWPDYVPISAEGGIVMDGDSGAVLYGKNIHTSYFPASITKILTALIVLENCDMDEIVTFSHNAVYNVESGSSSAGLDEGDQLCVRDCLYAMMLKSANEAANALAEHTAGSIENFAAMMNEKAAMLGCQNSHFNNPSGLNDPDHYTSAYDMALIAKAAFANEQFVEIDSSLYYTLPATKKNPDGITVYPGHKMMKKNSSLYYPGIIGGKTGYTSLAGNTLVTCAKRDNMKLITVVLNGQQTHYTDTKTLLDFGFSNFQSINAAEYDTDYTSIENDMSIAGLPAANLSVLSFPKDFRITLPKGALISDTTSSITYDLPADAPSHAVAQITYSYGDRLVGSGYLIRKEQLVAKTIPLEEPVPESDSIPAEPETSKKPAFRLHIPKAFWIITGILAFAAALGGILIIWKAHIEQQEEKERLARYQRRQERLQDIGMSPADFDLMMQERRNASALKNQKKKRRPKRHKSFLDHKKF